MERDIARLKKLVAFPRNLVKVKGKADRGVDKQWGHLNPLKARP